MPANRRNPPGFTRGTVYREVAQLRLEDARVLLESRRFLGAVYLAGYAVECLLKYGITRRQATLHLPEEFEIHKVDRLMNAAGLSPALQSETLVAAVFSEIADKWGPELRYRTKALSSRDASRLYDQTVQVYNWVNENVP